MPDPNDLSTTLPPNPPGPGGESPLPERELGLGERPEGRRNEDEKPREPDEPPRPGGTREPRLPLGRPARDDDGALAAYGDILALAEQPKDPRKIVDAVRARCRKALA